MTNMANMYSNKKVLITGGAGFIGSHLAEALVACGAHVTILDNFSTGRLQNLISILPFLTVIHADIRQGHSLKKATRECDYVFHLAACTSVPRSIEYPEECFDINVKGTQLLLEACVENNVTRVIFASSSAVYGPENKIHCETDTLDACSPYAQSKIEGEKLCANYGKQYPMITTSLRYFNVYGPRQNPQGHYAAVVARFTQQLKNHEPIVIFGDGQQTRDFVSVEEVTKANMILGAHNLHAGDCFNVATGKSITILELLEKLEQETNTARTTITFAPAREGDIIYSQASCEKYKNALKLG